MIAIIDCGIANLRSIEKALEKIGKEYIIAKSGEDLEKATHLIFPGVGAFEEGMKKVKEANLNESIREQVLEKNKPILGICLGMQLLFSKGDEGTTTIEGLNLIKGEIKKFHFDEKHREKIPHIGWNEVSFEEEKINIFEGIEENANFYFIHSYHARKKEENATYGYTEYGYKFISAIQKGNNIFGVQFHPEKSQKKGLQLLKNFCRL
jgi:imidazole glycerol-phosphate synthase subunit HisH